MSRAAKVLYVVPTADYQAYNNWGGKSLYFDKDGGANTVTGTDRAAKVSAEARVVAPSATMRSTRTSPIARIRPVFDCSVASMG